MNTAEAVIRHFRNTLTYIQARKEGGGAVAVAGMIGNLSIGGVAPVAGEQTREREEEVREMFAGVDVAGPLLKLRS